ncbi:MAG: cation transporter [Chitinophagaceae bacterium]
MTHTYNISGMTCTGCQAKVQGLLSAAPGIHKVSIDLAAGQAALEMDQHVATETLQEALKAHPRYHITEATPPHSMPAAAHNATAEEEAKTWWQTYKPVLLVFAYIAGATILAEIAIGEWMWMRWMNHFMAGFFLVFSFFKLLDLRGFADSYATYDIIARRWSGWGYVYAFTELALGLAFLTGFYPMLTNSVTFIVMSLSIAGVLQSVLNKRKIRCACLGAVFNLPMSTITIIEDALMIGMSAIMLIAFV